MGKKTWILKLFHHCYHSPTVKCFTLRLKTTLHLIASSYPCYNRSAKQAGSFARHYTTAFLPLPFEWVLYKDIKIDIYSETHYWLFYKRLISSNCLFVRHWSASETLSPLTNYLYATLSFCSFLLRQPRLPFVLFFEFFEMFCKRSSAQNTQKGRGNKLQFHEQHRNG